MRVISGSANTVDGAIGTPDATAIHAHDTGTPSEGSPKLNGQYCGEYAAPPFTFINVGKGVVNIHEVTPDGEWSSPS